MKLEEKERLYTKEFITAFLFLNINSLRICNSAFNMQNCGTIIKNILKNCSYDRITFLNVIRRIFLIKNQIVKFLGNFSYKHCGNSVTHSKTIYI